MPLLRRALSWAFLASVLIFVEARGAAAPQEAVADVLRSRLQGPTVTAVRAGGERLRMRTAVARFYAARDFQPAWLDGGRYLLADALLAAVSQAPEHGLRPADYHRAALASVLGAAQKGSGGASAVRLAELELLATDAFLSFGEHLLAGRLEPQAIDRQWVLRPRSHDLIATLNEALAGRRIVESLAALAPPHPGYIRLRTGLALLRQQVAAGGWPQVGALEKSEKIEPGALHPRIPEVRLRLLVTQELSPAQNTGAEVYDEPLVDAVRRFQSRHGLTEDGVIGPATIAAMNVSARERLAQIELNLERWRWLPELGYRHILINIPGFELTVAEGDRVVLEARVVVGTEVKPTPVFTGHMERVVFSPYWNVPASIAVQELLPQLQRNPRALAKQNLKAITSGGAVLDPTRINWNAYGRGDFPFRLRQEPGGANPLGRVKFIFPNRYDVYLHDTSRPALFERSQRTFSHGCIRVSKPFELSEYLLKHDPRWTRDAIEAAMNAGREQVVPLPEPVPVHLLYWTSWVDAHGVLQFRPDIYRRDAPVRRALSAL